MFADFAKRYYQKAAPHGWVVLQQPGAHPLAGDAPYLTFQRPLGKDLCVLTMFNTGKISPANYAAGRAQNAAKITEWADAHDTTTVFLLDVFVGDNLDAFQSFIEQGEPFIDQRAYTICWGVCTTPGNPRIITNPRQPAKIGGALAYLTEALTGLRAEGDTPCAAALSPIDSVRMMHHGAHLAPKIQRPVLCYLIAAVNAAMLGALYFYGGPTISNLMRLGALEPRAVMFDGEYYRLFTSMILHGGIGHFAFNTFALYIFGTRAERHFGRLPFLALYLLAGLGGSIAALIHIPAVVVGASGAIYGLVGALLALTLLSRKAADGLPASAIVLYALVGLVYGVFMPQVANAAHVGGFVTGFLAAFVLCILRKSGSASITPSPEQQEDDHHDQSG